MPALRAVIALLFMCSMLPAEVQAQRLPVSLPTPPDTTGLRTGTLEPLLADAARVPLDTLRRARVDTLLRHERTRVDVDPQGEPVIRDEYLVLAPDDTLLERLRRAGFETVRGADASNELGIAIGVLRDVRHRGAARAMHDLREAAPEGEFAFQHLYLPAGRASVAGVPAPSTSTAARVRIGLVDGGVDARAPALAGVEVRRFGCDGRVVPDAHGTAVATRLAGGTHDTLYAADLWCGDRVGSATLGLVQALAWMAHENVPVINVSLVGPDNPLLARAIAALVARGHVVVAAVGNDGPAAPPMYPAAYADVIGVSAVDARLRALPESASGSQVDFSAAGIVDARTRGTSFAAPIVARLAADLLPAPRAHAAADVEAALAGRARDLGAPGRDPRYGEGYVDGF